MWQIERCICMGGGRAAQAEHLVKKLNHATSAAGSHLQFIVSGLAELLKEAPNESHLGWVFDHLAGF